MPSKETSRDQGRSAELNTIFTLVRKDECEDLGMQAAREADEGTRTSTFCMASRRSSQLSYIRKCPAV